MPAAKKKKYLCMYEGPATGLSPTYAIFNSEGLEISTPTTVGVVELAPAVYAVSLDYHKVIDSGNVIVWDPNNGELASCEGPWDTWSAE